MGFEYSKRPKDLRTKASTDLKFHDAASTGSIAAQQYRRAGITQSTAGSTAFSTRGLVVAGATSTSAAANWILTPPAAAGEELTVVLDLKGSTFGITLNASTGTAANFGAVAATTSQIRAILAGTLGSAIQLVSVSTSQWAVVNSVGVTFSTAAA